MIAAGEIREETEQPPYVFSRRLGFLSLPGRGGVIYAEQRSLCVGQFTD